MRIILFLFFYIFLNQTKIFSQQVQGEIETDDCSYSKEIIIPFDRQLDSGEIHIVKPLLDQTVFYTHRDQFSFWYKLYALEDAALAFDVSPINSRDTYVVYVYQYNGKDFCEKVFENKISPVKPGLFNKLKENPYDLSLRKFQAKKGKVYYVSILNTSSNNCGHRFRLFQGSDTLKVMALHFPCEQEISIIKEKEPDTTNLPDTPVVSKIVPDKSPEKPETVSREINKLIIKLETRDSLTSNLVNGEIELLDPEGNRQYMQKQENGIYKLEINKDLRYNLSVSAVGYKQIKKKLFSFNDPIVLENTFILLLSPLQKGEKFVMKKIYFHPNTYALKTESTIELEKLKDFMLNNPKIIIEIEGHTNMNNKIYKNKAYKSLGPEWNFKGSSKALSLKRAEEIKQYLVSKGVAKERLFPIGYGGDRMIIQSPRTNEEALKNIRVEVKILDN